MIYAVTKEGIPPSAYLLGLAMETPSLAGVSVCVITHIVSPAIAHIAPLSIIELTWKLTALRHEVRLDWVTLDTLKARHANGVRVMTKARFFEVTGGRPYRQGFSF